MKIACIADVHVGNHRQCGGAVVAGINERCRQVLRVLERAYNRAADLGCDSLYILGDLLDSSRTEPQVVAAVQHALTGRDMAVFALLGNHEQVSTEPGDNSLAPLWQQVNLIEEPTGYGLDDGEVELLAVPFQPGRAEEWLPEVVLKLAENGHNNAKHRVLLFHLGISDQSTAPWLQGAHDSVELPTVAAIAEDAALDAVFAGNWHDHRRFDRLKCQVVQVGALVPTGWDNPGLAGYGKLAIYEPGKPVVVEELPGPRFIKVRSEAELKKVMNQAAALGHKLYVNLMTQPDELGGATEQLIELVESGALLGGNVLPDTGEAEAAARDAAQAARSAETLDEAVQKYVERMDLPEGVQRAAVLSRVQGYLAREG